MKKFIALGLFLILTISLLPTVLAFESQEITPGFLLRNFFPFTQPLFFAPIDFGVSAPFKGTITGFASTVDTSEVKQTAVIDKMYFLKPGDSANFKGRIIKLIKIGNSDEIILSIDGLEFSIASTGTKVIDNLMITNVKVIKKLNGANIRLVEMSGGYKTVKYLGVGESTIIQGKKIVLEELQADGKIIVSVDGKKQLISGSSTADIDGTKITNYKSGATLKIEI